MRTDRSRWPSLRRLDRLSLQLPTSTPPGACLLLRSYSTDYSVVALHASTAFADLYRKPHGVTSLGHETWR